MDTNERAFRTVGILTGQIEPEKESGKARGGRAAAARMTPEQRRERAVKAAAARWGKNAANGDASAP